ncbi:MAG: hypothetical protein AAGB12_11220 [Pseudomonadota bacterium]
MTPLKDTLRLIISHFWFLLTVIGFLFFWSDEKLNVDIEKNISQNLKSIDTNSNGFLYFLGFHASRETLPTDLGRWLIQGVHTQKNAYKGLWNISEVQLPNVQNTLPLPDASLPCSLLSKHCIIDNFYEKQNLQKLINEHQLLLQRFYALLRKTKFTTLTAPSKINFYQSYTAVAAANRLFMWDIALQFQKNPQEAILQMMDVRTKMITHITISDNLIYKSMMLKLMDNQLDWIEQWREQEILRYEDYRELIENFKVLSSSEISFKRYITKEASYIIDYYQSPAAQDAVYDRHLAILNPTQSHIIPLWVTQLIFKPNMTINRLWKQLQTVVKLSEMNQKDFIIHLKELTKKHTTTLSNIRSAATQDMLYSYSPDFVSRINAFHTYNSKLKRLKQSQHLISVAQR